jgi:hypothetical protein
MYRSMRSKSKTNTKEKRVKMSKLKYSRKGFRPSNMGNNYSQRGEHITSKYSAKYELRPPSTTTVAISEFKGVVWIHISNYSKKQNKRLTISLKDYEFRDFKNFMPEIEKHIALANKVANKYRGKYKQQKPKYIPRVKSSHADNDSTDGTSDDDDLSNDNSDAADDADAEHSDDSSENGGDADESEAEKEPPKKPRKVSAKKHGKVTDAAVESPGHKPLHDSTVRKEKHRK